MNTLLILGLLTVVAPVPNETKPEPAALKIRKILEDTGSVTLEKATFEDFQNFFKGRLKTAITIDPMIVASFDLTAPIFNVTSTNGKYRDSLKAALKPNGLTFGIVGGEIVIGTEDGVLQRQMRQTVSLDVNNQSLGAILRNYADETGANIVIDPRQAKAADEGKVTLKLDDVPLETAVRLATEVGGLRVVRMNNVLFVTSATRAAVLRPDADAPVAPVNSAGFTGGITVNGGFAVPGGPAIPLPLPPAPPPPR